ncbi:peptidoglycan editing factor PgeF [Candidatus Gottesmanbacteria bacterium]|nr:peptidoglycan editing factor PgeF [Candidatus Gottesmanbacteria bacterium]
MIQSKLLTKYKRLVHYFGERTGFSDDLSTNIKLNNAVMVEQVHGSKIAIIKSNRNKYIKGKDGMITNRKLFLAIRTADCLPIFFYDIKNQTIAAIHAGWKGLYMGIIKNSLKQMIKTGSNPKNILAAAGPHIQVCCYSVPKKRILQFEMYKEAISKQFLDLGKIALQQMLISGLLTKNIDISSICTSCDNRFWSYRRDKQNVGRMINLIGIISK